MTDRHPKRKSRPWRGEPQIRPRMEGTREARQAAPGRGAGRSPRWACRRAISARTPFLAAHAAWLVSRGTKHRGAPATAPDLDTGMRNRVLKAKPHAHVEGDGENCRSAAFTLSFRDVDVPCRIAGGFVYIQSSLSGISETRAATVAALVRSLEIGVSETGCASLALDDFQRAFHRKGMVEPRLVRSGGRRR